MGRCRYSAIIPAAGFSSRMGAFKPLLDIGGSTAIEGAVNTFLKAGIEDVRVVVGHNAHLLYPVLESLGVKIIFNAGYERGMYSSIKAGVSTLEDSIDAFFLMPADHPLVSHHTVSLLASHFENGFKGILYPCFNGTRGHPPLLPFSLKKEIMEAEPEGGLKQLLNSLDIEKKNVAVADRGVLIDLDTKNDYEKVIRRTAP
jgi:molybdenum cofactor cytidylyltransferase